MLVNLLGQWQEVDMTGQSIPVGGIVYYLSPIHSFADIWDDPIHTIFYVAFMLTSCALFSKTWIDVSGSSAKDVAKQLNDQQMMMPGYRDSDIPKVPHRSPIPCLVRNSPIYSISMGST